jgi:hypothetical protein
MVQQSAIAVPLNNSMIGLNCSRRSADVAWSLRHTPGSLSVTRSLYHQDKSDFSKLFLIKPRFVHNFATDWINIKVPKQHSVLWVPYWPKTFIWVDWLWKPFVCCLRSVHVITHARFFRLHKEELNPAVFTFRVRRNTSWVALDKYRKDSLNQKNIL